ncbi:MAG: hypothetical protein H0S80_13910 [Desulfovibrionaceae bacterium]|nr:hypothetical protein [Desulfovibrionaceae bacterium]
MNNNPNQADARDASVERELNELKQQYESLRDRKVRTEQDVANLTEQLETLKKQAEAEYGTSDMEELQALLEQKRQQNEEAVARYREHIAAIQADLAKVENGTEER